MAITRKTIAITDQQEAWIKARIASGSFTNDSEYMRHLIRKDQDKSRQIFEMQKLIDEAIESGWSNRTLEEIRTDVKKRLGENEKV